MQTSTLPTGKQLKQRCQLVLSVHSFFVVGIIVGFFYPLLDLSAAQYRILLYAFFPLAGFSWIASEAFYAVALKPINEYLTAYAAQHSTLEQRTRAFARTARFPQLCTLFSFSTYLVGGLAAGLALYTQSETFTLYHFCVVASAVSLGGLVGQIINFVLTKDTIQPIRLHLASQFDNLQERERWVQSIPLAAKLMVTLASLVLTTVLFSVFLAQKRAADAIERFQVAQQIRLLDALQSKILESAAQTSNTETSDTEVRNAALAALDAEFRLLDLKVHFLALDAEPDLVTLATQTALATEELQYVFSSAAQSAAATQDTARGDSLSLDTSATYAWRVLPEPTPATDAPSTLALITPASTQIDHRFAVLGASFFWMVFLSGAFALYVAYRVGKDFSRGADAVRAQLQQISAGDLTRGNCFESEDEFGAIARAVERTAAALHSTVSKVDRAASELESASEALIAASNNVTQTSEVQTLEIRQVAYAMDGINAQIQDIADSSEELNQAVDESSVSIAQLSGSGEAIHETAIEVNHRIAEISSSLQQMLFNIQQITQNSTALAEIAAQSASSIEETTASVRGVEKNAQKTATLSDGVIQSAEEGHLRVRQTISGMEAIRNATSEAREVTNRLGKRAQEIGDVVSVIKSVADETSLLALNAAIIAAQAGEHGRAFSVVADEIKDLAARVLTNTKEIDDQIRAVQAESTSAVQVIERGFDSVQSGVELSNQAGVSLDAIMGAARESGGHIRQIVAAVHEHASVAEHMLQLIENIGQEVHRIQHAGEEHTQGARVVHQNALTIEEASSQLQSATQEQAHTARNINNHVSRIRESTEHIRTSLKQQSTGCQAVAESLELLSERTRANEDSAVQMQQATRILLEQRNDLRKAIQNFKMQDGATVGANPTPPRTGRA